jgi:hypothetical protein
MRLMRFLSSFADSRTAAGRAAAKDGARPATAAEPAGSERLQRAAAEHRPARRVKTIPFEAVPDAVDRPGTPPRREGR